MSIVELDIFEIIFTNNSITQIVFDFLATLKLSNYLRISGNAVDHSFFTQKDFYIPKCIRNRTKKATDFCIWHKKPLSQCYASVVNDENFREGITIDVFMALP